MAARTLECAKECEILSVVVEDREAVGAVQRFLGKAEVICPCKPCPHCDWLGMGDVMGHVQ